MVDERRRVSTQDLRTSLHALKRLLVNLPGASLAATTISFYFGGREALILERWVPAWSWLSRLFAQRSQDMM